jgi:hypothetical protein
MSNPWKSIRLEDYEDHMSAPEVMQLQLLDKITRKQIIDNPHRTIAIMGVAGGNGLNHINTKETTVVYAIDINQSYLEICSIRYSHLKDILKPQCLDLSDINTKLPESDLLICNLIIEYLGEENFISLISRNKSRIKRISCVIQENNSNNFVSVSGLTSKLSDLLTIHFIINKFKLKELFEEVGFSLTKECSYDLPNGKNFIRLDFYNNHCVS